MTSPANAGDFMINRALGRKKDGKVALDKAREGASRHGRDPARGPAYAACVALLEG